MSKSAKGSAPRFQADRSNPANAIKDTMWQFLMDKGQPANIPALKGYVYDLIQMTTQMTAGQRKDGPKYDLNFTTELDMTLWSIVIEATALVLSGKLDKLEDKEGDQNERIDTFGARDHHQLQSG